MEGRRSEPIWQLLWHICTCHCTYTVCNHILRSHCETFHDLTTEHEKCIYSMSTFILFCLFVLWPLQSAPPIKAVGLDSYTGPFGNPFAWKPPWWLHRVRVGFKDHWRRYYAKTIPCQMFVTALCFVELCLYGYMNSIFMQRLH